MKSVVKRNENMDEKVEVEVEMSSHTDDDDGDQGLRKSVLDLNTDENKHKHLSKRKQQALRRCWEGAKKSRVRRKRDMEELEMYRRRMAADKKTEPLLPAKTPKMVRQAAVEPVRAVAVEEGGMFSNFL